LKNKTRSLELWNSLDEALIEALGAVVVLDVLDTGALEVLRVAAADEASPDSSGGHRLWALGIAAFVLHLFLEATVEFPRSHFHGDEDSLQSHLVLPLLLRQAVFHAAVDADRVVAGVFCVLEGAVFVDEAEIPVVEFQATGGDDRIGVVVGAERFVASTTDFASVLFAAVGIGDVLATEGFEVIAEGGHAGTSGSAAVMPPAVTAVESAVDLWNSCLNERESIEFLTDFSLTVAESLPQ
jgi:hypothetical protein